MDFEETSLCCQDGGARFALGELVLSCCGAEVLAGDLLVGLQSFLSHCIVGGDTR